MNENRTLMAVFVRIIAVVFLFLLVSDDLYGQSNTGKKSGRNTAGRTERKTKKDVVGEEDLLHCVRGNKNHLSTLPGHPPGKILQDIIPAENGKAV